MSTEPISSESTSTALATQPSAAERRVQLAKARLQSHLVALDHRARELAKHTAWIAGMVLLGVAGAAVAATMFGSRKRHRANYGQARPRGIGTALALTALGLLTRRLRAF